MSAGSQLARAHPLFVTAALNVGGAERQWAGLVPLLRERGIEPAVLTLLGRGPFYDELAALGESVTCADLHGRLDIRGIREVVNAERVIDVVVTQGLAGQVVGHLIARHAGVPHVTTEHLPPTLERRRHEAIALKVLARKIDVTIAVTESQIPDLATAGYRRSTIRVIPNGVSDLAAERPSSAVRADLGIEAGTFVAVLAAALRPQKQAHVFVEAVARAHRADGRICGLVVGAGPEFSRIESLARGTAGTVRTLGERTDVIDLLSMADVVCLSSKAEALPMVVLEAMALGRPIVATAVGGVPDALDGGATGVLVPAGDPEKLADALVALAADPSRAAQLGDAGRRRWAERYSAERSADAYADLLECVAHTAGPGSNGSEPIAADTPREASVA